MSNRDPKITFLICSWKAPDTLDETLLSIARQADLSVAETIVVNNGFSRTRALAIFRKFSVLSIRMVDEPRPGLGFARHTGFQSAYGDAIVLLDDDNTLGNDFSSRLAEVIVENPNWGCIRPAVLPVWGREPPKWLLSFGKSCLSYNISSSDEFCAENRVWRFPHLENAERPPGGGMILHRAVVEQYCRKAIREARLGLGRIRNDLGGCEDADIFTFVKDARRDVIACDNIMVWHHIPRHRTQLWYLLKLNYAMTRSYSALDRLRGQNISGEPIALLRAVKNAIVPPLNDWVHWRIATPLLLCRFARNFGTLAGAYFGNLRKL